MSKVMALGVFHTAVGKFFVFPCGCDGADNLDPKKQKASLVSLNGGKYPKPVWCTFETDYVFEDRPQEVDIED